MITLNTEFAVVQVSETEIALRSGETKVGTFSVLRENHSTAAINFHEVEKDYDQRALEEGLLSLSQYLIHRQGIADVVLKNVKCSVPFSDNEIVSLDTIERYARSVPPVSVAIVVLMNSQGEFLMGKRPKGKYMPGLWEFPGGKIEQGESPEQAGIREICEELGIEITAPSSVELLEYCFLKSRLEGYLQFCTQWKGSVEALHHEELKWVRPEDLSDYPMPLSAILSLPQVLELSLYNINKSRTINC